MAMSHRLYTMMAIALCAVALSCTRNPDAGGKIRDDLPLHQLHDGDLLFRCGTSTESQVVVSADKNGGVYSHVGIAFNDGGTWRVVHAVPGESSDGVDRVKVEPVDSFFLTTRAVHGAAMRLQGCSAQAAQQAHNWLLGKREWSLTTITIGPTARVFIAPSWCRGLMKPLVLTCQVAA